MNSSNARLTALRLERARRHGAIPASSSQLRLWLVDRLDPGNPVYNITRAFHLDGDLDERALETAFEAVVARQAVLRTRFAIVAGDVVAQTSEALRMKLDIVDLQTVDAADRAAAMQRELQRVAAHRFDLANDLMIRAALVRVAPNAHVLAITLHHIAVDERSIDVLLTDLSNAYRAAAAGEEPDRTPVAVEFSTHALRERAFAATDECATQLDFWERRLRGAPEAIALPFDRARPPRPRFLGATEAIAIDRDASASILGLTALSGASPFMVLLAAFALTLQRAGSGNDLVIGTPVSARQSVDLEATIGFFSNAAALRISLEGDPTFLDVIRIAKSATLDAFANGRVPFESVVARVAGERTRQAQPIFNVMYSAQSESQAEIAIDGVRCSVHDISNAAAKFDLSVFVRPGVREITVGFNYDSELFERQTIVALLTDYRTILQIVAASPNVPLSQLAKRVGSTREAAVAPVSRRESDAGTTTAELRAIEADVRPLWEGVLGRTAVPANEDFFEGGGHSLLAVRLVESIETKLGVRVPLAAFFETPTIERLARTIATCALGEQLEMQPLRRGTHAVPVVFFHGDMNGGGLYLRSMLDTFGDRTVYGVPPHGADGGPIPETIEAMASDRLAMLARAGVLGEVVFIGYCSGAIVALEAARQLQSSGARAPAVIALDADVMTVATRRMCDAVRIAGTTLRWSAARRERITLGLLRLNRDWHALEGTIERLRMMFERLGSLRRSATRPIANVEVDRSERLIVEYQRRAIRYRPERYLGSLTVLLAAGERRTPARRNGWSSTAPRASICLIPGDHATCVTTYAAQAGRRLRECLDA